MRIIDDISDFIFVNDKPVKSDVIIIAGGSYPEPAETAAALYNSGFSDLVLAGGKYSKKTNFCAGPAAKKDIYFKNDRTESEFFKDILVTNGVCENNIICEDQSCYTYENASFAKKALEGKNIKKAILCCQAFHARRALMYYSLYFKDTKFFVCPADTQNITKKNWHKTKNGKDTVFGEIQRIAEQFKDKFNF